MKKVKDCLKTALRQSRLRGHGVKPAGIVDSWPGKFGEEGENQVSFPGSSLICAGNLDPGKQVDGGERTEKPP